MHARPAFRRRGTNLCECAALVCSAPEEWDTPTALLNERAAGKVIARSAGSAPAAEIHPNVQPLLDEIDGQDDLRFPKPLTDDAIRAADVVITMGCGDVCPVIPGVHYEDWSVGDPALASADGVAAIRDDIARRVDTLLSTLTTSR